MTCVESVTITEMIKNKLPNIRYPVGVVPKACFYIGNFLLRGTTFKITTTFI